MFRKKSNQLPINSDLPPELRPFYGQQNVKSLRTSQLMAIIAVVIIVSASVLLILWLNGQTTNVQQAKSTTQSSRQASKSSNKTQVSSPTKTQTNTTGSAQSQQAAIPPTTMPDTGPGMEMFLIATGAALLGAVFYHFRQIKRL